MIRRRPLLRLALAMLAAALLTACAAATLLRDRPGTDLARVRPGASRLEVERVLGVPRRKWTSRAGVRYREYDFDPGWQGNAGDAGLFAFMDLITLGVWEAVFAAESGSKEALTRTPPKHLAVSYDAQDSVLGVFVGITEFTQLPEDGRPTRAAPD